ncbi:uncharacterized protein LOC105214253 [Zeugodacus cucurbitae]|uniref:uncharacterized protein LOC105214253 n=1 Tax=Zeugodacus cucurbitae TaxID=28588 RepID=UPI0023D906D3|nr:uncharacterized protein LOC105214253 [Zeugodacus cucurbitae]
MVFAKLFLTASILITYSLSANVGLLDIYPELVIASKPEYRNDSSRAEIGFIMNPGTPNEELVIMGMYTVYDEKTNTKTVTMYIADKNGYQKGFSIKLLKTFVG